MINSQRTRKFSVLLVLAAISQPALAEENLNGLDLSFTASSLYTDNALKTRSDEIEERQDTLGVDIKGYLESKNIQSQLNYSIDHTSFSKNSEDDEITVEGDAEVIAQISKYLEATAFHSRKQLLSDPRQQAIISNTDERNILGAELKTSIPLTPVDTLTITPTVTDVRYETDSNLDSERYGVNTHWQHQLSPISELFASYSLSRIQYEANTSDQDYERALIGYSSSLRKLSYRLEAGYNLIRPEQGVRTRKPYFDFEATYNDAVHSISLSASRIITDTSLGDGLTNRLSDFDLIDGNRQDLDQVTREELAIAYALYELCQQCTLGVNVSYLDEQHINLTNQNLAELKTEVFIEYQVNARSSLRLGVDWLDVDFELDSNNNYDEVTTSFRYDYQLNPQLITGVFSSYQERDATNSARSYSELIGGVDLRYDL